MTETNLSENPVAYFWRTYLEWRAEYGVGDACMGELVAAMQAELQNSALTREEAIRLRRLIQVIEAEVVLMKVLGESGVRDRPTAALLTRGTGGMGATSRIGGHA